MFEVQIIRESKIQVKITILTLKKETYVILLYGGIVNLLIFVVFL